MSSFDRDPRRLQELRGRPIADRIYRSVFGEVVEVQRFDQGDDFILDRHFAIDVRLTLPNGMILLGQEKFLSAKYARYATITVEYEQDHRTGERGDWFKLSPQFYFVGYITNDGDDFDPWMLLDWAAVVIATNDGKLPWRLNWNKDGRARASFMAGKMHNVPEGCIIASSLERDRRIWTQEGMEF